MMMNSKRSPYFTSVKVNERPRPEKRIRLSRSLSSTKLLTIETCTNKRRLGDAFFDQEATILSRALLGKVLVRQLKSGDQLFGRIVETEAYLGPEDKAAHSSHKRTERTEPMFMKAGTIYIFSIYGMYHCMNLSSRGDGAAVLLRAIEPLAGIDQMKELRRQNNKRSGDLRNYHPHQLCNGPSKLCLSYGINKELNGVDITISDAVWIEEWSPAFPFQTVTSVRIGLSKKAEEWIDAPLRFYVKGSKSVSVRDKTAESIDVPA